MSCFLQAQAYTTNHIMMLMGGDFQYQKAGVNYKNIDKLIRYVNEAAVGRMFDLHGVTSLPQFIALRSLCVICKAAFGQSLKMHLFLCLSACVVDIKSQWRHNWKSVQVVNSHLVCDPTIRQLGFDLPRQQWSLLNRFCTEQGHCGACRRKRRLTDTDLCPCGETQTMSHIVESCPLTKLNGGLSRLHSADKDAV